MFFCFLISNENRLISNKISLFPTKLKMRIKRELKRITEIYYFVMLSIGTFFILHFVCCTYFAVS